MTSAIDTAQKEYERWRQRERRIHEAITQVNEERVRLGAELERVEQQVVYYDNLTRDMKKELRRPGLSTLLSSMRRP